MPRPARRRDGEAERANARVMDETTASELRCQGHARCWQICPDVFDLDDEGHASVVADDVPAHVEDKVREAVRNCPERAITMS